MSSPLEERARENLTWQHHMSNLNSTQPNRDRTNEVGGGFARNQFPPPVNRKESWNNDIATGPSRSFQNQTVSSFTFR